MTEQPLKGVKVLELGAGLWGSYCTKLLADFGADVIKVEPPSGDPLRQASPYAPDSPDVGGLFCYLNTNKRSLRLDAVPPTGRRLLQELVLSQDVLVEELGPQRRGRLGLSYGSLHRRRPCLILTSITPFGESGPYARFKADDLVVSALATFLHYVGEPGREPLKAGGRVGEVYLPGVMAAVGTLIALQRRDGTGTGDHVMVSAVEAILEGDRYHPSSHAYSGQLFPRAGASLGGGSHPYDILPCKDGYVAALAVTDVQWEMFAQFLGRPELAQDPRFDTHLHRGENWAELRGIIVEYLARYSKEEAFHAGQGWRLPFGFVAQAGEALELPQHLARQFFVQIPVGPRSAQVPGQPFLLEQGSWQLRRPAPGPGQHTDEVLEECLGLAADQVRALRSQGIVR